jgi:hypothetical protein
LAGPTFIGRNGSGVVLALDNDYDSVARNSLGTIISDLPLVVQASVHEGKTKKDYVVSMEPP